MIGSVLLTAIGLVFESPALERKIRRIVRYQIGRITIYLLSEKCRLAVLGKERWLKNIVTI